MSDLISKELFDQIKWERDIAIGQLKELGYGLGEKIRTDKDVISRQTVIDEVKHYIEIGYDSDIIHTLENLPSAQPEGIKYVELSEEDYEKMAEQFRKMPIIFTLSESEIIRCGDCKYWQEEMNGKGMCADEYGFSRWWKADDFCSNAERKEGEEDE